MPFLSAQSAIGTVICAWVENVRTMKGERVVVTEADEPVTICGIFASADSGATASATGVGL
jgi:hypothetical protein